MFVITADQVASRRDADRTGALVETLTERYADQLVLPADQTAGDEIQLAFATVMVVRDDFVAFGAQERRGGLLGLGSGGA